MYLKDIILKFITGSESPEEIIKYRDKLSPIIGQLQHQPMKTHYKTVKGTSLQIHTFSLCFFFFLSLYIF